MFLPLSAVAAVLGLPLAFLAEEAKACRLPVILAGVDYYADPQQMAEVLRTRALCDMPMAKYLTGVRR